MPTYNKNRVDRVTMCVGAVKTKAHLPSYRSGNQQAFAELRENTDNENVSKPLENRYVNKEGS